MAEMNLQSEKKCNIIFHGLSTSTTDNKAYLAHVFDDEFNVKDTIASVLRLGWGGTFGSVPLLATLSLEDETRQVIRLAKNLCNC